MEYLSSNIWHNFDWFATQEAMPCIKWPVLVKKLKEEDIKNVINKVTDRRTYD